MKSSIKIAYFQMNVAYPDFVVDDLLVHNLI